MSQAKIEAVDAALARGVVILDDGEQRLIAVRDEVAVSVERWLHTVDGWAMSPPAAAYRLPWPVLAALAAYAGDVLGHGA